MSLLFLLASGIMHAGGGKLMDVLGTRWGYALMPSWWSLANFMHPLSFLVILVVVRKVEMVIPAEGKKIAALV